LITAEGTEKDLTAAEPKISILENTNSLLVHATPRQHASVALVIAYVDRQLDQASTPYVVYPLENQKPEELRTTLEGLIQESMDRAAKKKVSASPQDPRLVTTQQPQTGGAGEVGSPMQQAEKIKIIDDKASNSLIVYANKKNQQWIAELIKKLDQYRSQVLLDCTLVEIRKDDLFALDLQVISKKGGMGSPFTQLTNPITGTKNPTVTNGTALEGTFSSVNTKTPFSAFYGDDNIQALLTMMDRKSYGRVLSRPSILVKDNEKGEIKAEETIYVAQPKTESVISGTGPGTTNTSIDFKDYTAGLTLTITPHIASEKLMQLEIKLDRKDFAPGDAQTITIDKNTYTYPKDTSSNILETWSIVPSGSTIILGGIEKTNQLKANSKVPILGDIPLIGLLFRGINQADSQKKLYIFVKANIIQAGDELTGKSDIERISQRKRKTFEEDEARFQGLDSVPGLKPNPVQPKSVLEDDEYIGTSNKQPELGSSVTVPID
jgi:type II secretory pathway component GspD/PulD (secretin)